MKIYSSQWARHREKMHINSTLCRFMKLYLAIGVFIILSSAVSEAKSLKTCETMLGGLQTIDIESDSFLGRFFHYKVTPTILEINKMVGDLQLPPSVKVSTSGYISQAGHGEITWAVRWPMLVRTIAKRFQKTGFSPESILAHEYGHLIFETNFPAMSNLQRDYQSKLGDHKSFSEFQEYFKQEIGLRLWKAKKELEAQGQNIDEIDEIELESNIWQDVMADPTSEIYGRAQRITELEILSKKYRDIYQYWELFADTVSVLFKD
ncbi:MAG: hypothetical protein ACHQVK_02330, partial [Candidatus Paceibacterales bacterium]